ncbi:MAG: DNA internalization-related competence protein ComEC/Rec2 [Burkholderiales bacterium]|jgi:competence protein ComEC|nr:DNA internalization-related competence protein ComEC/Rec2 [Burkholderiales bacterium]
MSLFAAPLIAALTAFSAGVALMQTRATLPDAPWTGLGLALLFLGIGTAALLRLRRSTDKLRPTTLMAFGVIVFSAAVCGYDYAAVRAQHRLADALPSEWEGRDIVIRGVIDDLPDANARGTRFSFAVEDVLTPEAQVPSRIALTWYARSLSGKEETRPELRAGERWQLKVRLKRPHASINPGGFDVEAWLLQNDIRATGYVRPDIGNSAGHETVNESINTRLSAFAGRPFDYIQHLRENIRDNIRQTLHDKPYAGVITALVIGEQRAVPDSQWQVFRKTGIIHLVSISGLHVTVFSTLLGGLLFQLFRRMPRLTSRCPAIKLAVLAGFFASAFYVALAGAGIPAQRTLIMLAVVAFALWTQRTSQPLHTWLWSLFAVVLWDPWAPLTAGFWLSFGAVGWLLYAASGRLAENSANAHWRKRWQRNLALGFRTQCVVTLGLTPLLLAVFQAFSLVSLPANFWAIPWITLLVVPTALLGAVPGLSWLWIPAHFLLEILMTGMIWLAQLPISMWQQHGAPTWSIFAAVLGILWMLMPRGVPVRSLGALWCLPMFLIVPLPPPVGSFQATVLDVGQGLSVFVRTNKHALLYDTGPGYFDDASAGNRIVAPFLQFNAINAIDALVVSHSDNDHNGGTPAILAALPVRRHYTSLPAEPENDSDTQSPALIACIDGLEWTWDDVHFHFLSPPLEAASLRDANNRSCVLKIESPHGSLLLTGDIGKRAEKLLTQRHADNLKSDILVAPHHGSRHSSTLPFVSAVAPSHVVYSVGYRNRFDFPRPDTVTRYETVNATQWRTDYSGAVRFTVGDKKITAETYRQTHPRYWR